MSHTIHVVPAPGCTVRHPQTLQALPPEGEPVTWSSYWQRRIDAGEVSLLSDDGAAEPPANPETPTP